MSITRLARLLAAVGVLAAVSLGFVSPASAASTASWTGGNGGVAMTVTYSGATGGAQGWGVDLLFFPQNTACPLQGSPFGAPWSYYLGAGAGSPVPLAASPATVNAGTNAMAPGGPQAVPIAAGTYQACLYAVDNSAGPSWTIQQSGQVVLGQAPTPRNDTLVDNGNGSMTATFEPTAGSASIFINLFPSGTTCPSSGQPTGRLYVLSSSSQVPTPLMSPATIAAGTTAYTVSNGTAVSTTIAAGSYQACLYYNPGSSATVLEQSLAVTLSEVVAPDPVTPAFTG